MMMMMMIIIIICTALNAYLTATIDVRLSI